MRFQQVIGSLAAFTTFATAVDLTGYEYVVVGSGAGGGYVLSATLICSFHL
jgi:choline dehydrogenase